MALNVKDWKKLMRSTYTERDKLGSSVPVTPLRMLFRIYPDLAEHVLDKCIEMKDDMSLENRASTKDKIAFEFNQEFIDDTYYIKQSEELMKDGNIGFDYCPAKPDGTIEPYDEAYTGHGKVRMDNHPLKIICKSTRMVKCRSKVPKETISLTGLSQ